MPTSAFARVLPWELTPMEVMQRWPGDQRMLALVSSGSDSPFDHWTILAAPAEVRRLDPFHVERHSLLEAMRSCAGPKVPSQVVEGIELPFVGGWIGLLTYECGVSLDPCEQLARVRAMRCDDREGASAASAICKVPRALLYSHRLNKWIDVGDGAHPMVALQPKAEPRDSWSCARPLEFDVGWGARQFESMARRAIDYIHAGDCYQVNLALPMRGEIRGSPRQFAIDAMASTKPRYGAYLELDACDAILSFSPELFLSVSGSTGRVVTRPMKGTRSDASDPSELLESAKDAAELHMIVDLMRNDLGRVCTTGSVRVEAARLLECHPTVLQTVGEVSGQMPRGCDAAEVIAACFPPGSVTGAPKIRAMQLIAELEPTRRGAYCGAIGAMSQCGSAGFSVAIRTAQLNRAQGSDCWSIEYWAGCGIVAESDPAAEARELLDKTQVMRRALALSPAAACETIASGAIR